MPEITFRQRLRYQFDNTMAKGPAALIAWLALVTFVMILMVSVVVVATGMDPQHRDFSHWLWGGLMRAMDAGTMGGDEGGWAFLFTMLAITLGGIFILSILIGVLTTGIEGKLEELRKGRSFVAETDHTVILGWSSQVFTIISELVLANENRKHACIAILAEGDTVEMMDEIRARVPETKRTHIVCRSGAPIDPSALDLVNPQGARSIIILPPEEGDADAYVIKTILALTNSPGRRKEPYHIVGVIRDRRNYDVARMVGRDEVELVLASELIARVTAQTCRQSGLSVAYTELMDYGGDEIYFKHEPSLEGKTFAETLVAYEDSAVMGIRFAEGRIQLNPPMDTALAAGDQLIVVSQDDDTIKLSAAAPPAPVEEAIRTAEPRTAAPERTLILGWNDRGADIVRELDAYVGPGSTVLVVDDQDSSAADLANPEAAQNLKLYFRKGDTTDRRILDALTVDRFHHIIVLSSPEDADPQEADARTLVTLLHLRDIADKAGRDFSIVSEMLDVRNRELAQATRADDFIVSDKLVSLLLSQISENKELAAVFADLFDPEGSEIYLKPAGDYVELGRSLDFYTVVESARRRGQVAIGYRRQVDAFNPERSFGVQLNPKKSNRVTFGVEDKVIVLAEE
jgi:voltage-gated potassium channel Kch